MAEYWLYDPTGGHLASRLRGMRLVGDGYRDVAPEAAALGERMLHSAVLGLDLRVARGGALRVRDPVTGRDLLAHDEAVAAYEAETAARVEEAAARRKSGPKSKPRPAPVPRRRWRSFGRGSASCKVGGAGRGRDRSGKVHCASWPPIGHDPRGRDLS